MKAIKNLSDLVSVSTEDPLTARQFIKRTVNGMQIAHTLSSEGLADRISRNPHERRSKEQGNK